MAVDNCHDASPAQSPLGCGVSTSGDQTPLLAFVDASPSRERLGRVVQLLAALTGDQRSLDAALVTTTFRRYRPLASDLTSL